MPVRAEIVADLPLIYTREKKPLFSPLMPHSSVHRGIKPNFIASRRKAHVIIFPRMIQSCNWDINPKISGFISANTVSLILAKINAARERLPDKYAQASS